VYKRRTPGSKRDPFKQWKLPDKVFFAAGACHMLAYEFLECYPKSGFEAFWIRPIAGHTGNHIILRRNDVVFDYHGFSEWPLYWAHTLRRANQWWSGWSADLVHIHKAALISRDCARDYQGLWMKEPHEFLFDPLERARRFLQKFAVPASSTTRNNPQFVMTVAATNLKVIGPNRWGLF
jgi:hypothetical protein